MAQGRDGQPGGRRVNDRRPVRHRHELHCQRAGIPNRSNGLDLRYARDPSSPATIVKGDQPRVEVTVTNSISRDQGYLKISKVFDPLTSGFTGTLRSSTTAVAAVTM